MSELSVGIIAVYLGKLPEYFPVWEESCRKNPTIDFFLVTDQKICSSMKNMRIIPTTLDAFRDKATRALGFRTTIDTPFKLCDYKPAYGLIFQDLLSTYDYWGHCDIDLIWGDIRSFLNQYHLEDYDKFLPLGHLSLYKNTPENNRRFQERVEGLSTYKEIFQSSRNYLFDELGIIQIYTNRYSFFDKIVFADINPIKRRYTMCTSLKYYPSIYEELAQRLKTVNFRKQIFMWENGRIYQYYLEDGCIHKREFLYIHLQKRKWKLEGLFSDRMVISQNGVFCADYGDNNVFEWINTYNRYSAVQDLSDEIHAFIKHCWSYFKRRIIRIEPNRIIVEKRKG